MIDPVMINKQNSKSDTISILFGSDFHFGNPEISQEEMAKAFAETIFPLLAETDIFFINGDFFDTLVIFDNHGFDFIYETILNLFTLCELHQVSLRLLQGTWTHDRNQLKRLEAFFRNNKFAFDFHLATTIELEEITIRDRSLRIMYVPDDLPFTSSDDVVDVIKGKMTELGWDYIDYGCMHGFFDFTFHRGANQTSTVVYQESQFPFIRKVIDVGHVHQNRTKGNVISNGSFDRHCHGDEDPKGCIKVTDYPDRYVAQFVENKNTAIFDSLRITKEDTTETICDRVNAHLASLTTSRKISLRFIVDTPDQRLAIKTWMKEAHPEVAVKFKHSGEVDDKPMMIPSSVLFTAVEEHIAPTPKTIATFIRTHIPEDYILSTEDIERYLHSVPDKA